jgi:CRP/FNR family cyclic AMP-dependent transcriptional regulator
VVRKEARKEVRLAVLGEGDFFGEMAPLDRKVHSAAVRALDEARVPTVERPTLLRGVHEDPSLGFRIVEKMFNRIPELDARLVSVRAKD